MARLWVMLWIFLGCTLAATVRDERPAQTSIAENHLDLAGWMPMPTQAPDFTQAFELRKRQSTDPELNATCGFWTGIAESSITCDNGEFCAYRSEGVRACCGAYYSTSSTWSLSNCAYATACYDGSQVSTLTGTQLSDSYALYCTSSRFSYCMIGSYTDIESFSIYHCWTEHTVMPIGATWTKQQAASTTPSTTATTTSSSMTSSTTSSSPTPPPPGPNNTPAIVGGAVGGVGLVLIAAAAGFFFWLRHKRKMRAAGNTSGPVAGAATYGGSKGPETSTTPITPHSPPPPQYYVPTEQRNTMMAAPMAVVDQRSRSPEFVPSSPTGPQEMFNGPNSPTIASRASQQNYPSTVDGSVSSVQEAHGQPVQHSPNPAQQTYVYQPYRPGSAVSPHPVGRNSAQQRESMGFQASPTSEWERHEMA